MEKVYKRLAQHLDNLPGGYPRTESGVEMRILKRLFTPQEAELAVCLTMIPEDPVQVAERFGGKEVDVGKMLERMAKRGLIFRKTRDGRRQYAAAMFVIGIWEYHLNDLDEELVRDVNEYMPYLAKETWLKNDTKQLRIVPVSKQIAAGVTISAYEDAEEIIKQQSKIVVQPCICRKEHDYVGEPCSYPMEVCFSFGTGAYYYEENGLGRAVSVKEALEILETGRKAGLVLQPGNAQKPANICMCCGCCCQILKNMKALEKPAQAVHSNYVAQVDADQCTVCGVCAERCHMDAITVEAESAHINPDRCIGCGVCVPECPEDAIGYQPKPESQRYDPPETIRDTYLKIAQERGKI